MLAPGHEASGVASLLRRVDLVVLSDAVDGGFERAESKGRAGLKNVVADQGAALAGRAHWGVDDKACAGGNGCVVDRDRVVVDSVVLTLAV